MWQWWSNMWFSTGIRQVRFFPTKVVLEPFAARDSNIVCNGHLNDLVSMLMSWKGQFGISSHVSSKIWNDVDSPRVLLYTISGEIERSCWLCIVDVRWNSSEIQRRLHIQIARPIWCKSQQGFVNMAKRVTVGRFPSLMHLTSRNGKKRRWYCNPIFTRVVLGKYGVRGARRWTWQMSGSRFPDKIPKFVSTSFLHSI